jgi:phosphate transport system substrate-binding protein
MPFALVQNKSGKFVKASPETVSAAGEGALDKMGTSLAVNIWNQSGADAYPISAFTYIIIYKDLTYLNDSSKARAVVDFIRWATHDGQSSAASMDYAPLSPGVQKKVDEVLSSVKM